MRKHNVVKLTGREKIREELMDVTSDEHLVACEPAIQTEDN